MFPFASCSKNKAVTVVLLSSGSISISAVLLSKALICKKRGFPLGSSLISDLAGTVRNNREIRTILRSRVPSPCLASLSHQKSEPEIPKIIPDVYCVCSTLKYSCCCPCGASCSSTGAGTQLPRAALLLLCFLYQSALDKAALRQADISILRVVWWMKLGRFWIFLEKNS